MRLVLDTSVIVSAVRSPQGGSRRLVDDSLDLSFDLLLSVPLLFEYESVLMRPVHLAASGQTSVDIERFLIALRDIAVQVPLMPYIGPRSSDDGDNHVLSLASFGSADAIVTHNLKHFAVPAQALGVSLISPGEALGLLRR